MASRAAGRLDLSVTMAPHELLYDLTTLGGVDPSMMMMSLLDESATTKVPRGGGGGGPDLAWRFYEIAAVASRSADALDAVDSYSRACEEAVDACDAWERPLARSARLADEADAWTLLRCLHLDELREALRETMEPPRPPPTASPRGEVELLFERDAEVRLMQTIVDWLETRARRRDAAIPPVGRAGGALHWENALHAIQNGASLFDAAASSAGDLITELDPDAPRRQAKKLHALDRQDDDALCRRLFKELRCGRFADAVALCVDAGQMWRAIVLHGWRLLDHPDEPQEDSTLTSTGNASRDLWKMACSAYLDLPEENAHFKACLGALSGRLDAALPVCSDSREDLLWALLKTQIELRVDRHLRDAFPFDKRVDLKSPRSLSLGGAFAEVESLYAGGDETKHQSAQRRLALDRADELLSDAAAWARDDREDVDLLRFLCHLALSLEQIGKTSSKGARDAIVEAYVERLIENGNVSPEPIAFYASKLSRNTQSRLYSNLMQKLESSEDRLFAVEAGNKAGIDVESAAKETVRRAIKTLKDQSPNATFQSGIYGDEEEDRKKVVRRAIDSLEWLSFFKTQIFEAVSMSNAIIRILVFKGDVDSATAVLTRLTDFYPSSSIAQTLDSTSNYLREHFCLKAYLEAIDGYAAWYRRHVGGRPKSPDPLPPNVSFTDKVHHEQIKANVVLQQQKWAAAGLHQANHVKQLLYNVLLFPEGWLVDDVGYRTDETDYELEELMDREKQLDSLRKLCVPETVLLLLKILQTGGQDCQAESVRLAEVLASEKRKLYLLFPKHKLQEVLHKIAEASLNSLENNRDPWGFSVNQ